MKRTISTLLIAILLPVIAGCTRNDGDIGTWFGSWKLERITIDGLIDEKVSRRHLLAVSVVGILHAQDSPV